MAPTVNVSTASIADLISQRDEMVEALRRLAQLARDYGCILADARADGDAWDAALDAADAALANVEKQL